MKNLMIVFTVVLLSACASSPKVSDATNAPGNAASRTSQGSQMMSADLPLNTGNAMLHLEFDETGQWARISTLGTAELADESANSPAAIETAYMIATLRAKRALTEFLSSDIRSTRTLKRISRTVARSESGEPQDQESQGMEDAPAANSAQVKRAERLATVLSERITEQTAAILRGAHVARRTQRDGGVVVELVASRLSIEAAREISRRFSGAL